MTGPNVAVLALTALLAVAPLSGSRAETPKPDIVVAAAGSGDFRTIQEAVNSIPRDNHQRTVVLIKDGVYKEKVRIDTACVTLRGQSRKGTCIEYSQLNTDFEKQPDDIGRAVVNVNGNDFVLENLTLANTAGIVGPHSFAIYGKADRTVIIDCDVLSEGADTVSLWLSQIGRYYHARCHFRGGVDFVCPRGWCYVTDCTFYETKNTAAIWHDGRSDKAMKFVLRNCRFDGVAGWYLGRHHVDAQFYLLDCSFSSSMTNKPLARHVYRDDPKRNADLDKSNVWGERNYYYNCHRDGGDYSWHKDNLSFAPNSPAPEQITAAWTFAGKWNPEQVSGPVIQKVSQKNGQFEVAFNESVTVKGKPRLVLKSGGFADYATGSGSNALIFAPLTGNQSEVMRVDLQGGAIIASEAAATIRMANVALH